MIETVTVLSTGIYSMDRKCSVDILIQICEECKAKCCIVGLKYDTTFLIHLTFVENFLLNYRLKILDWLRFGERVAKSSCFPIIGRQE